VIDKRVALGASMKEIADGATVLVGGFGNSGEPMELLSAPRRHSARELTVVANNGGSGHVGLAALLQAGPVRKLICFFPRTPGSVIVQQLYREGSFELEVVPRGTLAERIRAAGAGIAAFFTPSAADARLGEGKERRTIDDRPHVLEHALYADVTLIQAQRADRWGNLTYHRAARNYNLVMATAARTTIAQVKEVVELGSIGPDQIVTPCTDVDGLIEVAAEEFTFAQGDRRSRAGYRRGQRSGVPHRSHGRTRQPACRRALRADFRGVPLADARTAGEGDRDLARMHVRIDPGATMNHQPYDPSAGYGSDVYRAGMMARREVLTDQHVDHSQAATSDFSEEFQDLITPHAWGVSWARPVLDRRMRSALTLALLAALHNDHEIPMQVRAAVRHGLTPAEIREIFLRTSTYAGVPVAHHAMQLADAALRELVWRTRVPSSA
jgi:3-oxoadipate CoA-transferase alpha subunit